MLHSGGRHPPAAGAELKILIFGAGGSSIRPLGTITVSRAPSFFQSFDTFQKTRGILGYIQPATPHQWNTAAPMNSGNLSPDGGTHTENVEHITERVGTSSVNAWTIDGGSGIAHLGIRFPLRILQVFNYSTSKHP